MFEKLAVKLMLKKEKSYFEFIFVNDVLYTVKIEPYESLEELLKKAVRHGVLTADKSKLED